MPTQSRRNLRAGIVAAAPLILLAALSYHPYLAGRQPNYDAIAEAVTADPTRWGIVHLATGAAAALLALAFLAVRAHLREAGEDRWSAAALPFVIIGSTLYAMLPAMELAPLAAHESGGDVEAAQRALTDWFVPVLVIGALTFGIGMVGFALAVARSGVLSTPLTRLVVAALVVMALSRFVPLSAVQFYLHGAAAVAALMPLAHVIWRGIPGGIRPVPAS